jgi:Uma2 family endonuclease
MGSATPQQGQFLSVPAFRAWQESRPDEEHWELIGGLPVLQPPRNRSHQRVASNLVRLLTDAFAANGRDLDAYHAIGVTIASPPAHDLVPDVVVIREAENPDPRYAERFYLAAEVFSESESDIIEIKRGICRAHPTCRCILLLRQDRAEITVDTRAADGWNSLVLLAADTFVLPEFGLSCPVADVFARAKLR